MASTSPHPELELSQTLDAAECVLVDNHPSKEAALCVEYKLYNVCECVCGGNPSASFLKALRALSDEPDGGVKIWRAM